MAATDTAMWKKSSAGEHVPSLPPSSLSFVFYRCTSKRQLICTHICKKLYVSDRDVMIH